MKILFYRTANKDSSLKANFSVCVSKWGDFIINNCALFDNGEKRWISFPSNKVEKDGEIKYYPYVKFASRDVQNEFQEAILNAVEQHIANLSLSPTNDKKGGVPF